MDAVVFCCIGICASPCTGRVSQSRGSSEIALPGATSGGQEMDDADSQLAGRTQPLQHSLAGTDARLGESSVMKRDFYSDGQGRGTFACNPIPKTKPEPFTLKN